MLKKKGIILFAYYYPPIKSMGVMRSYALSHAWLEHFEHIWVITTSNANRLTAEPLPIDPRIQVIQIPTCDYRTITSIFSKKSHYSESSKKSLFGKTVVKLLNSFPFNKIIGEGGLIYQWNAKRTAKRLIKKHSISHIFSSFRPYSDHIVASRIKRKYPAIKWIADFRDIHVDALKQNVYFESYQHRQNKAVVKHADIVGTVSKGCADHLRKYHPRVHLIYNGINDTMVPSENILQDTFSIAYTGSLYGHMRDPSILFKGLHALEQENFFTRGLQIVYAGKDSGTWNMWIKKFDLEKYNVDKGLCSFDEARTIQKTSHINLQLTFAHPEVTGAITGKLMEYVQARRPIVCIINGSRDKEIESFFDEIMGGIVVYNNNSHLSRLTAYIKNLYSAYSNNQDHQFNLDQPLLQKIAWPKLADDYLALLDNQIPDS